MVDAPRGPTVDALLGQPSTAPLAIRIRARYLALVVVGGLLASVTAYLLTTERTPVYAATTTLVVGPATMRSDLDAVLGAQRLAVTYASLATSDVVLQMAIDRLALPLAIDDLRQQVEASVPGETSLVVVRAEDADSARAAAIADAVGDAAVVGQSDLWALDPGYQAVDDDLAAIRSQLDEVRVDLETLSDVPGLADPRQPPCDSGWRRYRPPTSTCCRSRRRQRPRGSTYSRARSCLKAHSRRGRGSNAILAGLLALALGLPTAIVPVHVRARHEPRRARQEA